MKIIYIYLALVLGVTFYLWIHLFKEGFFGGFIAGAFGLGGGVVFSPILLSLGMPPRVSSSTGSYLITFSKISSCLIYAIAGKFVWDYAIWISFWSVLGAFFS